MNENIKPVYKNGVAVAFDTVSTAEVKIPSMRFDRYEDAELAVSIAKAIQARGNKDFDPILSGVKYTFRILADPNKLIVFFYGLVYSAKSQHAVIG